MRRTRFAALPMRLGLAVAAASSAGAITGAELRGPGAAPARPSMSLFVDAEAQTADGAGYRFVDDHPRLSPSQPPDVAAPKFSRIIIEKTGLSRLEGDGTPGSQVLIKSDGAMIGAALVDSQGNWAVSLEKALALGDHAITSVAAGAETTQPGDEVRVFIPAGFSGREIVAYDRTRAPAGNQTGSVAATTLQRARELSQAASKRFSELVPGNSPTPATGTKKQPRAGVDVVTPVAGWFERASQAYRAQVAAKLAEDVKGVRTAENATQPPAKPDDGAAPPVDALSNGAAVVRDWMKNANDTYNREVAKPLSIPVAPAGEPATPAQPSNEAPASAPAEPVLKAARPSIDASGTSAEAARKVQQEILERQKAMRDAEAREEAQVKASAEAQRQAEEARRRQADDNLAKARDAERAAAEAARKDADANKIANGLKRLEAAEQAEKADAARKAQADARAKAAAAAKPASKPAQSESASAAGKAAGTEPKSNQLEFKIVPLSRKEERARAEDEKRRAREAAAAEEAVNDNPTPRSEKSAKSGDAETASSEPAVRRDKPARSCPARTKRDAHNRRIYVVQPGDTLWAIAHRHYRKGSRYPIIYRANQDRLESADVIRPCQKLVIPERRRR